MPDHDGKQSSPRMPDEISPELDQMFDTILEFVNTPHLMAAKEVLIKRPQLMTDEARSAFLILIDAFESEGDLQTAQTFESFLELTELCRTAGIEEGFDIIFHAINPPGPEQPSDAHLAHDEMLAAIVENTVLVMTSIASRRETWLGQLETLHEATLVGDDNPPFAALLSAIIRLIEGEEAEDISPKLDEPYLACWQQIIENIAQGPVLQAIEVDMFYTLTRNTLTALSGTQEQREDWLAFVYNLKIQANDLRDVPLQKLTQALIDLFNGKEASTITPAVNGPYRTCWERIIEAANAPSPEPK